MYSRHLFFFLPSSSLLNYNNSFFLKIINVNELRKIFLFIYIKLLCSSWFVVYYYYSGDPVFGENTQQDSRLVHPSYYIGIISSYYTT